MQPDNSETEHTPFGKADVGRFIPLTELTDKLEALRRSLIASGAPGSRLKLRGTKNRPEREAWHAMFFARAYECYFSLDHMSVRIESEEDSAHDATLRWTENNLIQELLVQLKELPSESQNKGIPLKELIAKSIEKYPPSKDLTLAFFIGRNLQGGQIEIPDHQFAGLWIFGITGIEGPEFISLVGNDARGEHSNCKKFLQSPMS
jgi:hypothetical protein